MNVEDGTNKKGVTGSRKNFIVRLIKQDGTFLTTKAEMKRWICDCSICEKGDFCDLDWKDFEFNK